MGKFNSIMKYKVTIEVEVDTENYNDIHSKWDCVEFIVAALEGEADWPTAKIKCEGIQKIVEGID